MADLKAVRADCLCPVGENKDRHCHMLITYNQPNCGTGKSLAENSIHLPTSISLMNPAISWHLSMLI